MTYFSWFLAGVMTLMTWRLVRRVFLPTDTISQGEASHYLERADAEPLPEEYVQPLGDACVDITRMTLDALGELDAAKEALSAADGRAQQGAPTRIQRALVMVRDAAEQAAELTGELHAAPEEVGWWLGHVLEQCETLGTLEETAETLLDSPATAVHRAAVGRGIEAAENLLLGAHDFSERLLNFDLKDWIQREIGREAARRFERGIADAVRRSA